MLVRDLLATLPGLVAQTAPMTRAVPTSFTVPDVSGAETMAPMAGLQHPVFMVDAESRPVPFSGGTLGTQNLQDFYASRGGDGPPRPVEKPPVLSPEPTPPTPPEDAEPTLPPEVSIPLPPGSTSLTAEAGRVLYFTPATGDVTSPISEVKILSQATHGHVSVNSDNSLSLVLSEDPTNTDAIDFRYEIIHADGQRQEVDIAVEVTSATQDAGWGLGNFYMLEEDSGGQIIVEHGDNHRKVYITGSDDGLTRADIARAEGIPIEKINSRWMAENPEYGASPEMALSTDIGIELWTSLTSARSGPGSHWLLFERGYTYEGTGRLVTRASEGESELHPLHITAYGEGAAPKISDGLAVYQQKSTNVVVQNLELNGGFSAHWAENLLLNNLKITGSSGLNIQNVDGFTFRNSSIFDVVRETPANDSDVWDPSLNRAGGAFIKNVDGLLIESTLSDRNGWAEGYDFNLSGDFPMPPSMFSHNYYLQADNLDVTFRDNIVMRAASFGVQVRSGGFVEDNVFLDNNAAINFLGGDYKNAGPVGHFTLMQDNIISSAGHKRVSSKEGAVSMGVDAHGNGVSLIGNIVAHLADPNNAAEFSEKTLAHDALKVTSAFYDDTIVFNWFSSDRGNQRNSDINVEGLDPQILNATTIQNFTANFLGKETATISDLANHLRDQAAGQLDHVIDADLIVAFFQKGFGLDVDVRSLGTTLRFTPDERGDGMRWDNRINWSTNDLPGTSAGDSVDLGGNKVMFGAQTVSVDNFIFGDFGMLKATSGRLNINGTVSVSDTGAGLMIDRAGQVWMQGYLDSDQLTINVAGGRFANVGDFSGATDLMVHGNGQALLAVSGGSFDLGADSSVTVASTASKIGFDGATADAAVLRLHDGATLNFVAAADGLGQITEFRSGAFGASSQVTSGVRLDGTLNIDLSGWEKSDAAGNWTLIKADQIIGSFDDIQIAGLGNRQDALVRFDYVRDEVILVLGDQGKGSGMVRTSSTGDEAFINYADSPELSSLWDALNAPAAQISDNPLLQ